MDEAWTKVELATREVAKRSKQSSTSVWAAAEAVEFASLLFSLANGLEDFDPEVRVTKKDEPKLFMKKSADSLKGARELRQSSPQDAYASLRTAAENLKTLHLRNVKEASKKRE